MFFTTLPLAAAKGKRARRAVGCRARRGVRRHRNALSPLLVRDMPSPLVAKCFWPANGPTDRDSHGNGHTQLVGAEVNAGRLGATLAGRLTTADSALPLQPSDWR